MKMKFEVVDYTLSGSSNMTRTRPMHPKQIQHAKRLANTKTFEFETPSQLAEFLALSMDVCEELDDETSEIWQIAFDAFVAYEDLQ
jgi:hypothetical protein